MRAFATLLGAFLFAALPLAASAQGSDFTDAAKRIEQDGTTVNVYVNGSEAEGYVATVAVSREGYVGAAMAVADIFSPLSVPEVSFVEMDKSNATPEIFVTHWTGGAHCCVEATVFSETDDSWRALDVGAFDGDPESLAPHDIDDDAQAVVVGLLEPALPRLLVGDRIPARPALEARRALLALLVEAGVAGGPLDVAERNNRRQRVAIELHDDTP